MFEKLVMKQSFKNKNGWDQTINKNITTKKNFDERKNLILYYFITSLLRGVRWCYLICMHLQLSTLWGK